MQKRSRDNYLLIYLFLKLRGYVYKAFKIKNAFKDFNKIIQLNHWKKTKLEQNIIKYTIEIWN